MDEIEPAVTATGGIGDAATEENFEHCAGFQKTAHCDGEETSPVSGGFAAGAFRDVEDDAEGRAFELIAQVGTTPFGEERHGADMEFHCHVVYQQ